VLVAIFIALFLLAVEVFGVHEEKVASNAEPCCRVADEEDVDMSLVMGALGDMDVDPGGLGDFESSRAIICGGKCFRLLCSAVMVSCSMYCRAAILLSLLGWVVDQDTSALGASTVISILMIVPRLYLFRSTGGNRQSTLPSSLVVDGNGSIRHLIVPNSTGPIIYPLLRISTDNRGNLKAFKFGTSTCCI